MAIFICDVCSKEFTSKQALGGHKSGAHKDGPRYKSKRNCVRKQEKIIGYCRYCGSEHKNNNSLRNHERICKENPKKQSTCFSQPNFKRMHKGNQFTKAKELGLSKPVVTEKTREKLRRAGTGRTHSDETKRILSEKLSLNNKGGRSKWYEVNGVKVQGTWERNVAEILTEKGINWIKPSAKNHSMKYEMDGKIRTYTPDFYLTDDNLYLEIKGYWWGNDREKMKHVLEQNPKVNILIIEKCDYEKILSGELVW